MNPDDEEDRSSEAAALREQYAALQAEHRALSSAAVPDMAAIDAVLQRLDETQAALKASQAFRTTDRQRY